MSLSAPATTDEGRWWSVRLVVDPREVGPISEAIEVALVDQMRHLVFGGHGDEFGDPPHLTFELWATSARDAEERAQGIAYRTRCAAGLPDALLEVAWVAPLGAVEASSRFLDDAIELFDSEKYGLAVIAAQTHFEVQLRALLERAAQQRSPQWLEALAQSRLGSLSGPPSWATLELLLGVDVTELPEWYRFCAHIRRRNDVVHEGQSVERTHAKDSLQVVRDLWIRLARAGQ